MHKSGGIRRATTAAYVAVVALFLCPDFSHILLSYSRHHDVPLYSYKNLSSKTHHSTLTLNLRMLYKNLSGRDTFYRLDDFCRTVCRNTLDQKMRMIFIRTYLDKLNLISF